MTSLQEPSTPSAGLLESALSSFLTHSTPPASTLDHPALFHQLALQVQHNLQYQHDWIDLTVHTHSPLSPTRLLSRPLIAGVPPQRIYVHPDEQIELLTRKGDGEDGDGNEVDLKPERVWVLPTHLKEKWSLKRFAEVFDAIGRLPPESGSGLSAGSDQLTSLVDKSDEGERGVKRILLATVSDDSTVMYYIVHDGIVKPRQN